MSLAKVIENEFDNIDKKKKPMKGFFYPKTRNIIIEEILKASNTSKCTKPDLLPKLQQTKTGFLPFVKERDHLGKLIHTNAYDMLSPRKKLSPKNFSHDNKTTVPIAFQEYPTSHLILQTLEPMIDDFINLDSEVDDKFSNPNFQKMSSSSKTQLMNNKSLISYGSSSIGNNKISHFNGDIRRNSSELLSDTPDSFAKLYFDRFTYKPIAPKRTPKHFLLGQILSPKEKKSPCFLAPLRKSSVSFFEKNLNIPLGIYEYATDLQKKNKSLRFSNSPKVSKLDIQPSKNESSEFNFHEAFDRVYNRKISAPTISNKTTANSPHKYHHSKIDSKFPHEEFKSKKELDFRDMKEIETRIKLGLKVNTKNMPVGLAAIEEKYRKARLKYNIGPKDKFQICQDLTVKNNLRRKKEKQGENFKINESATLQFDNTQHNLDFKHSQKISII